MHNDDIDFKNALCLEDAGKIIGVSRRSMLTYIQQGLLRSRYASQSERKTIMGMNFHSRLLLVDKDEVMAMYNRIPTAK